MDAANNRESKMEMYSVHCIVGELFEDILVKAASPADAIKKARKLTTLPARLVRWADFII